MKVLVACEYSARVRDAFRSRGHDAWSCDLEPCEGDPRWHVQGPVEQLLARPWDLLIAHPPCTYLTNSGVRWLHSDPERWEQLRFGAEFFKLLLSASIERIAVENPVMHRYARELIQAPYTQIIHPWQFGHRETKQTCLWLKNLPPLRETNNVYRETMKLPAWRRNKVHYASPGKDRWKDRSRTYEGIAEAMAEQWG